MFEDGSEFPKQAGMKKASEEASFVRLLKSRELLVGGQAKCIRKPKERHTAIMSRSGLGFDRARESITSIGKCSMVLSRPSTHLSWWYGDAGIGSIAHAYDVQVDCKHC